MQGLGHFKELLIEVNFVFSLLPRPFMMVMIASAIPAAINPYSTAVAPLSSAQNFSSKFFMDRRLPSLGKLSTQATRVSFSNAEIAVAGTALLNKYPCPSVHPLALR
jgi:hypothetical protein